MKQTILMLFLSLLIIRCSDDNGGEIIINPAFNSYVDSFIESGRVRGIDIDFSDTGLSIQFGEVDDQAAAECSELGSAFDGSHRIIISEEYWNQIDDLEREVIIFHELGHCELGRIHDGQIFSNGDWKSIMRGFPISQKEPAVYFLGTRKNYYLDELFNPSLPFPDWKDYSPAFDINIEKELVYEFSALESVGNLNFQELDQFLIDINISSFLENGDLVFRFGSFSFEKNYTVSIQARSKRAIIFKLENKGILNVMDLDKFISSTDITSLRIKKNQDRIDVFLNGIFIYWLDGDNVSLDLLEVESNLMMNHPMFSGKIFKILN